MGSNLNLKTKKKQKSNAFKNNTVKMHTQPDEAFTKGREKIHWCGKIMPKVHLKFLDFSVIKCNTLTSYF